ncbi:PQQ-binding-like beta-propeller repeat protein [Haloplanus litoreus]|uniref:outer membrane protein assembly factor BamB family protein n=1 Tax=Haloplanus litoreus TaxID=767515 RepID=UPI0036134245
MVTRRHTLALLGSTATVGLAGCLGGSSDPDPPATVTERPVDVSGSIPQYQVGAGNAGTLPDSAPSAPTVAWRRTPNRYDAAQPTVDGDAIYVAFDGDLVKLAIDDGDEVWTVDAGHAADATPALHDDTVYATVWNGGESVPRGLVAVDAGDGSERWRALTENDVNASPTPTGDAVFVGGGFENGEVAAVEHDGTVRWRRDLGEYSAAPAVVGDRVVYATGEAASVVALDAVTGDRLWERSVDGRAVAAPTVAGDAVVVADERGGIRSLGVDTGDVRWNASVVGAVRRSVAVDEVIVATHEGGATALTLVVTNDGRRTWGRPDRTDADRGRGPRRHGP